MAGASLLLTETTADTVGHWLAWILTGISLTVAAILMCSVIVAAVRGRRAAPR